MGEVGHGGIDVVMLGTHFNMEITRNSIVKKREEKISERERVRR